MIYLFLGDYKKVLNKANSLVSSLLKKQPDATVLRFNQESFKGQDLNDLILLQGLFFNKNIIVFSKVFEDEESRETFSKKFQELKDSENIFVFAEENLDKKSLEKFEKFSEKIQKIEAVKKEKDSFNIFSLTELFCKKDKKNLWLLYLEAVKKTAPEEIYGILWWQIKTILIAKNSKNVADSGLKPFVFNKAIQALRSFKENEIEKIGLDLINTYHNSRRKSSNLEIDLEKWILKLN
jgi:hypothetical protein